MLTGMGKAPVLNQGAQRNWAERSAALLEANPGAAQLYCMIRVVAPGKGSSTEWQAACWLLGATSLLLSGSCM